MARKTILVPYDGEKASKKGLEYASDLAKPLNAEVVLLRVVPDVNYHDHTALLGWGDRERIRRAAKEESKRLVGKEQDRLSLKAKSLRKKGIKASIKVVQGVPADMILQVSGSLKPYMVVMGGRKLEGLAKVKKLGSVTRKVAENLECGILIVR